MEIINFLHDPLCPLNTCLDHAVCDRLAVRHTKKPISLDSRPGQIQTCAVLAVANASEAPCLAGFRPHEPTDRSRIGN